MRGLNVVLTTHRLLLTRLVRTPALYLAVLLLGSVHALAFCMAAQAAPDDAAKIMGPNACAECHKEEAEAWKGTSHFSTFRGLPRNNTANDIAQRMGVRRVKSESLCLNCHFTVQEKGGKPEAVAGTSCESCHGAGRDWIKIHSGFSGKSAQTESKTERDARWKLAQSKGMIRPKMIYQLAKNCIDCHAVTNEGLVNKGGHRAGDAFELVSWSQGNVRHNTWHSKGKENVPASAERKRMLYIVGLGVELETALRAVAKATARKVYAFAMAKRADRARQRLAAAGKAAPDVPEIARIVALAHSASLTLNNEAALTAAADGISEILTGITSTYDGSTMAGLDGLIPGPDQYKGKARAAGGAQ
jgi:Cytochrome c554 and c-prime